VALGRTFPLLSELSTLYFVFLVDRRLRGQNSGHLLDNRTKIVIPAITPPFTNYSQLPFKLKSIEEEGFFPIPLMPNEEL